MRSFAKNGDELGARLSEYLKSRLAEAEVTYAQLGDRLRRHGYPNEDENSIKQKLKRGKFGAGFFLATLAALGDEKLDLRDI